jgi:hypothetical protein
VPVADDEDVRQRPAPGPIDSAFDDDRGDVLIARRRAATFGARPDDPTAFDHVRAFVRRYGWRAYALPVLAVISVVALMTAGASAKPKTIVQPPAGHGAVAPPPTATGDINLKSDQPGANAQNTALPADALPSGAAYSTTGTGTFRVLPGHSAVVGSGTVHRYSVEVENGITGVDVTQFATMVQSVLSDKRSWAGHAGIALQRVDSGPVDFHIALTTSMTVRAICGYDIPIETSCFSPAGNGHVVNRVVVNIARWVRGDPAYVGDLNAYRIYMINHEDGHALGHEHAHECLAGGLAPVMMQQTIGLKSAVTGALCAANPWPYPAGVTDAPGAEQPDTPQNSQFQLKND